MRFFVTIVLIISLIFGFIGCSENELKIFSVDGDEIAAISNREYSPDQLSNDGYASYVELVLDEAILCLSEVYNCSKETAEQKLFNGGFTIKTAFDNTAYSSLENMYSSYRESKLAVGCSITDYSGNIKAVFSGGENLYAIQPHSPFSTIKPLSVYAQALENGAINWATKIEDTPYKKITSESGADVDWPTNPNGMYSYQKTELEYCIKNSLNTTAVHCLNDVGVENSIVFLRKNFDMNLSFEQNKCALNGADEVIGNIAMGYLNNGFTTMELAGYYQVFGNLGRYVKPHCILGIYSSSGKPIYEFKKEEKRIFREDTAYIMNRLLKSVVSPSGTGSEAEINSAELVGKTGTGTTEGNWFVGLTPEYCCSVWHGDNEGKNIAASMFSEIFKTMPEHTVKAFKTPSSIMKITYCVDSGMKASSSCHNINSGYFASKQVPRVCEMH